MTVSSRISALMTRPLRGFDSAGLSRQLALASATLSSLPTAGQGNPSSAPTSGHAADRHRRRRGGSRAADLGDEAVRCHALEHARDVPNHRRAHPRSPTHQLTGSRTRATALTRTRDSPKFSRWSPPSEPSSPQGRRRPLDRVPGQPAEIFAGTRREFQLLCSVSPGNSLGITDEENALHIRASRPGQVMD